MSHFEVRCVILRNQTILKKPHKFLSYFNFSLFSSAMYFKIRKKSFLPHFENIFTENSSFSISLNDTHNESFSVKPASKLPNNDMGMSPSCTSCFISVFPGFLSFLLPGVLSVSGSLNEGYCISFLLHTG